MRASSTPDEVGCTGLKFAAELVDFLGVKHGVIRFEQSPDGRFVQFHFESADADRAVADLATTLNCLVARLNAGDSRGRHRVEVNRYFNSFALLTNQFAKEFNARSASRNDDCRIGDDFA